MKPSIPPIVFLDDPLCQDPALSGGKAARLAELIGRYPVPPGFVITLGTSSEPLAEREICAAYAALIDRDPGPVARRGTVSFCPPWTQYWDAGSTAIGFLLVGSSRSPRDVRGSSDPRRSPAHRLCQLISPTLGRGVVSRDGAALPMVGQNHHASKHP